MIATARACVLALLFVWPGQAIDDAARAWVQAHRPAVLEAPMREASSRGRFVLIAGGVLALFAGPQGRAFVIESVLALAPVNAAVEGLKWVVNRSRPDGTTARRNSSFPSSHAANAFTVAAVITRRWRRATVPAWLAAVIVAYSRLFLDRHWLSDVAFALVLGVAGALLGAFLQRRLRRPSDVAEAA